jgi:hypothetical protein
MPEGLILSQLGARVRRHVHEPSEENSCAQPIEKPTRLTLDNQSPDTRKSNIFVLFLKRNGRRFLRIFLLSRE